MLHYIIQVVIFQFVFLLVYELLLKRETFFTYNRVYLLLSPVIAMGLPFLQIGFLQHVVTAETMVLLPEVFIGENRAEISETPSPADINWWLLAYLAGSSLSLLLFFRKFRALRRLLQHKKVNQNGKFQIVEIPHSTMACTFYNTVFLGEELSAREREQVLSHELVHVKQRHTLDLLYFEILKILFWFNPLIYIYQNRITALHEFIADAGVVKTVEKQTYYQQLLNAAFNTRNISFINQFFNQSLIKKRIVMLQQARSKKISKAKFLIILPLMLAMLTYVSCSQDERDLQTPSSSEVLTIEVADLNNQTPEEKEFIKDAVAAVTDEGKYQTVFITDGESSIKFFLDPATGKPHIEVEKSADSKTSKSTSRSTGGDVPFAVVEEVPVFPGCEDLASNEERKACLSQKITEFVNQNFDTSLGKELGLQGVNRIYVQFRINKDGAVEVLGARAPHPALQEEAERVINSLADMEPGKHRGEAVGVLYSLPISFNAGE